MAESTRAPRQAAEDVAAADHQGELAAERVHVLQLGREGREHAGVDAIAGRTGQGLPADLEEDAAVAGLAGRARRGLRLRARLQRGSPWSPSPRARSARSGEPSHSPQTARWPPAGSPSPSAL